MKWVLTSNHRSTLQEYHLVENDDCKVIMKYNPLHRSARISCGGQHRLFFIESAGSLTGKHVFKNEYGIEIGNMNQEKRFGKDGSIMIEATKYAYTIKNNPPSEIIIYKGMSQQPLISCEIDNTTTGSAFSQTPDIFNKCLLLGFCWYLSLQVTKETRIEHAA